MYTIKRSEQTRKMQIQMYNVKYGNETERNKRKRERSRQPTEHRRNADDEKAEIEKTSKEKCCN